MCVLLLEMGTIGEGPHIVSGPRRCAGKFAAKGHLNPWSPGQAAMVTVGAAGGSAGAKWSLYLNKEVKSRFEVQKIGESNSSPDSWETRYKFPTTLNGALLVEGTNARRHAGIILSTSDGLVTDESWKCVDKRKIQGRDMADIVRDKDAFPNAVVSIHSSPPLRNHVYPPHAKYIWAQEDHFMDVPDVLCFHVPGDSSISKSCLARINIISKYSPQVYTQIFHSSDRKKYP